MKKARRGETSFRSLSLTCIHGFVSVWGDVGRVCLCGVVSPLVGCFFAWLLPVFPPHPVNRRSFHCSLRRLMKGGLLYVLLTVCQSFRLLCADNTAYTTRQFESTWDDTQTFLSPVKTRSICMCLNVAVTPVELVRLSCLCTFSAMHLHILLFYASIVLSQKILSHSGIFIEEEISSGLSVGK